jgi:hypothetical protein
MSKTKLFFASKIILALFFKKQSPKIDILTPTNKNLELVETVWQGDQIGRIFAQWAIV